MLAGDVRARTPQRLVRIWLRTPQRRNRQRAARGTIRMGSEDRAGYEAPGDESSLCPTQTNLTTPSDEGGSRWRDPGRTIALSDGVFAIIMTLLVLDLLTPEGPPGHLLTQLLEHWPAYVAYLASWLLTGVVWLSHVSVFDHIRRMDDGMQWCNLAVLVTTGLLPFPTAVLAQAIGSGSLADERVAVGLYGALGTLTTLSWLLFFQYISRHPALLSSIPAYARFPGERAVIGGVLYLAGTLLGVLVSPLLALVAFVGLPIFYALTTEGLTIGRGRLWRAGRG